MKARVRLLWLCCMVVLPVLLSGCGGLHATGSVSPLDFLLPGAGKLLHVENEKDNREGDVCSVTNGLVAVCDVPVSSKLSEGPDR